MTSSPSSIKARMVKKMIGFPPGNDNYFVAADFHAARTADVFRESLPQIRQSGRRSIMRPAFAKRIHACIDHVRRRIEVGLADLQMNDVLALTLQRARFVQYLERGFGAQARHAAGELQFVLRGSLHGRQILP